MLKWAVLPKREATPPQKSSSSSAGKRRRSSLNSHKRRSEIIHKTTDENGDNNKENQFTSTPIKNAEDLHTYDAFRDVSNLTPASKKSKRQKKKRCVDQFSPNFKNFGSVDSHIESIILDDCCKNNNNNNTYAPTLPTYALDYSPCAMRTTHCLTTLNKSELLLTNNKFNAHVNDFLQQISCPRPEQKLSPLAQKLMDLNFSKLRSVNERSSFINDLSLDELVNAILDSSTSESPKKLLIGDSGFKENSQHKCQCNNNNNNKTIINIEETFNERCVDVLRPLSASSSSRKRQADQPLDLGDSSSPKRLYLLNEEEECFTLKRQKCIRRRNTTTTTNNNNNNNPKKELQLDENNSKIRRCLLFESPKLDGSSFSESASKSLTEVKGCMDLEIRQSKNELILNVIRCKDLFRANGKQVNAYVKATLSDRVKKLNRTLQRTAVQADSVKPFFNQTFKFPIGDDNDDGDKPKRLYIDVWHRDRTTRTSEFLGCMSFPVENGSKKVVSGCYSLLPQSTGRFQNAPITSDYNNQFQTEPSSNMCEESRSSVEEIMSLDELENDLKKTTSKTVLTEQQKYADENLFLRYLELDPVEGPNAIPAALQRKATGNKNGRTPFTQTKKLVRAPKTGFGFSVVWTHPPRIERVEKGLPAEKSGILPGDYIIFVDKHNVVMMPEIDILNLIRSYGSQLTLEIFRRNSSRNGSVPSVLRLNSAGTSSTSGLPLASSNIVLQRRPSTVCSTTNTTSMEYSRKKLHLPQVTFSSEKPAYNPEDNRRKTMFQLIAKEQQYATCLQFAITRFVTPLLERPELITPSEHRILFQNCEEILRVTEDILDMMMHEESGHHLVRTYYTKLNELTSLYKRYCSGIKKADCVLANKFKNSNSEFVRFVQVPAIPRRRPDITTFIHKPLEHFREVLKLLTVIQGYTKHNHEDYSVINHIVHDLQITYREITAEAGLMEPIGEGRPLLTVQDLENRLVFTKCKPFVLNKPGRQWIFGGDLGRVEGRNVRQYWTLLFSDLLLFAKVSRDRVLFIMEDPLPLINITDMFFNIRKKDTEFRITAVPGGRAASSPTVHCGPELTRTPRKSASKRTIILRAPSLELKAVWQNLLQRQIFHVNAGMDGSSFSSPLESPDAPITSSVATLQSAESFSFRRQTPQQNINHSGGSNLEIHKQIDALIERKCKMLSKTNSNHKSNAIHLEKWMKGQLDCAGETEADDLELESSYTEDWTAEMLRQRSQELQLIDSQGNVTTSRNEALMRNESRCEEINLSDDQDLSPSKSTTTESQVTVRSSPLIPETVAVCRQCHKNCLSTNSNGHIKTAPPVLPPLPIRINDGSKDFNDNKDWRPSIDPFAVALPPKISVVPPTPESSIKSNCKCNQNNNEVSQSDDSPQTEEHPYHSLSSSNITLRRFGTVSSLERFGDDETLEDTTNKFSSDSENEEEDLLNNHVENNLHGIDNEAFTTATAQTSIISWTAKAGSFVAEKMSFWGEDYRNTTGGKFFERYLKTVDDQQINGDDCQEEETSGATSGEEVWGTPTSGDDPLSSPNYDGKQSPNDGSMSSDNDDEDTELMMDELLMTPHISGATLRGLLPRRTLEPLIEEDISESYSSSTSSSSSPTPTEPSISPEQDNRTGNVADTCSTVVESHHQTPPPPGETTETQLPSPTVPTLITRAVPQKIHRAESYRRILEAVEDGVENDTVCFNRFRPVSAKFGNIRRVQRSVKIFEFFNVRRSERRVHHESFTPEDGHHLIKVFGKEDSTSEDDSSSQSNKSVSPRRLKDKQLDRRFWKQLSKRRGIKLLSSSYPPA